MTELETKLTKAIFAYRLREMLTRFGIREDQKVRLTLRIPNSEPLASVVIPTTTKKTHIQAGSLSLESFQQKIKDEFINGAINTLNLQLEAEQIELIFSSSDSNFSIKATCCCVIEGYCCCYC